MRAIAARASCWLGAALLGAAGRLRHAAAAPTAAARARAAPAAAGARAACPPPTHPGLTLAAVGDMMLGTDFPENILPDDDGVSFLDAVTPILSNAGRDLRQSRRRAAWTAASR